MYFDELMHVATNTYIEINTNTMHQYVVGPAALKTMMHMLLVELDRRCQINVPGFNRGKSEHSARCHYYAPIPIGVIFHD